MRLFVYVRNDPINRIDPDGRDSIGFDTYSNALYNIGLVGGLGETYFDNLMNSLFPGLSSLFSGWYSWDSSSGSGTIKVSVSAPIYIPPQIVVDAGNPTGSIQGQLWEDGYVEPGIDPTASFDVVALGAPIVRGAVGIVSSVGRGLTGLVSSVSKGSIGRLLGDETGAIIRREGAESFFRGAKYSDKVVEQMRRGVGEFHSFPESVRAFEDAGSIGSITGGDGITRGLLEIPGSYPNTRGVWVDGVFQFIKDADGTINHRMFIPTP